MANVTQSFHAWDYVIFVAMLLVTLGIGIFHALSGGRQRTTSEYLVGNRKLKFFPVSVSLTASFFSSILMLGFPAEAYTNGGMYWIYAVGIAVGATVSAVVFVPVIYPLQLTSVNDYLYLRYNSRLVSVLGALSAITGMLLYTSIVYFAPATAFERVTGFPTWASILVGSALTIIYTSIGGIKAVIWADVFQATLMFVGLLTISITAILKVGSLAEVWSICDEWGRMNIIDLNPDPTKRLTFWSLSIGVGFFDTCRYGSYQPAVQRYSSLPTITKARLVVLSLIPWTTIMTFLASLSGVTIFAYYARLGCDPLAGGFIQNSNQLVPHFVADTLNHPGIQGILMASLVSASLSTASSTLNSSSANMWRDVLCPIWPSLSEKWNVLITKLLVVVFGVVSTGLSFLFINLGGTVVQMVVTFMSATLGPTTAMFLLGIFFPFANWIGAVIGGFIGFIFALWMGLGTYSINRQRVYLNSTIANCTAYGAKFITESTLTTTTTTTTLAPTTTTRLMTSTLATVTEDNPLNKFYSVSYLWIACFSMIIAFIIGLLISLISGRMHGVEPSPKLLHPWVRHCYHAREKTDKEGNTIVNGPEKGIEKSDENEYVFDKDDEVVVTRM